MTTTISASYPQVEIDVQVPAELIDLLSTRIQRKLPGTVRRIALEAKSFWKAEAGRKLRSSRLLYQNAIDVEVNSDGQSFTLVLDGYLPYMVEMGTSAFDMKPGLLKNAKPWPPPGKRRFPRAKAETFAPKSITRYRIVPLNVNRYINMQKPTVFRTVHDQSPADSWRHPGLKGVHLLDEVIKELDSKIIPKHMGKLFEER